jgi:septal ring factor EnvC (AmiA/AmiB activator)
MKTFLLLLAMMALATSPSWAANDSREKQVLRRMQQQVQQIEQARALAEQEKAAALADKETAERELEKFGATKRQLAGERAARRRMEAELEAVQTENQALKTRLADTEKQLADSVALQRATAQTLAQTESAKKHTDGELSGTVRDLQSCRTHNGSLYTLGREMMQKYRDKSCQDALAQAEPFTGLKKVEVENLLEIWRDRLDREKLGASGKP